MIDPDKIPAALKTYPQWIVWKIIQRDGKDTKIPCSVDGSAASSTDPATWAPFEDALDAYERADGGYAGVGFVFAEIDPFCGIDLDGCRDPQSMRVADWAKEIIKSFDTYTEVSPSETGVKMFAIGKNPLANGKNKKLEGVEGLGGKVPGVEIYDRGRFFAVTGMRVRGPEEPKERQDQINAFTDKHWPTPIIPIRRSVQDFRSHEAVMERARKYITRIPGAVSGNNGHNNTFHVACVLVLRFGLPEEAALECLREWNDTCDPPWPDRDLVHKVKSANNQPGPRNDLRDARQERWESIKVQQYKEPPPEREVRATTLKAATSAYVDSLRNGKPKTIKTGLPGLDAALEGGVEFGEMVVFGARPSHGKSAAALQCVHTWTRNGLATLIISEEMSARSLGKRTLQFLTDIPEHNWEERQANVSEDVQGHFAERAECYVVESCGTAQAAVEQIEKHVHDFGVKCVVVDYAQLLSGKGNSRYEQMSNMSVMLRQCASNLKIVLLALCQLNREVEKRTPFIPKTSDLRESGQIEQDADVIVFLVWPHRIDQKQSKDLYQFFIAKNRNRGITKGALECQFNPSRQMLVDLPIGQEFGANDYQQFD